MPHLPPDPDRTVSVRDELVAMKRLAAAYDLLDALDDAAHERVLRWAADRFHGDVIQP